MLVRDWNWMDFCSRPAIRSISSSIAPVVMRHSSLLLMVLLSHEDARMTMPRETHYCCGSGMGVLVALVKLSSSDTTFV